MMKFRPFDSKDLIDLNLQEFQKHVEKVVTEDEEHGKFCMLSELAWTGLWNGKIIGAGGVLRQTEHKGQCWMVFSADVPMRAWPAIVKKTRENIEKAHDLGMYRLWADVLLGHFSGERFIQKLGFEPEGIKRYDGPNGEDQVLYAKIKFVGE
jgi:hypothetical protein